MFLLRTEINLFLLHTISGALSHLKSSEIFLCCASFKMSWHNWISLSNSTNTWNSRQENTEASRGNFTNLKINKTHMGQLIIFWALIRYTHKSPKSPCYRILQGLGYFVRVFIYIHTLRLQAKEYFTSLHFGSDSPDPSLLDDAISSYFLFIQVEIERWNLEQSSKKQKGIYTEQNKKVYRYWAVCLLTATN